MSVLLLHRAPDVTISAADFWIAENDPFRGGPPSTSWTPIDSVRSSRARPLKGTSTWTSRSPSWISSGMTFSTRARKAAGRGAISDIDMRVAMRALKRSSERAGEPFKLPFRDDSTWKSYWIRKGAAGTGGWQARRDPLGDLFDGVVCVPHGRSRAALWIRRWRKRYRPASVLGGTRWIRPSGNSESISRTAETPQDYKAVGLDCVTITEALGRVVYNHARHTPAGEAEPHEGKTKLRLERYIEERLPGAESAELRKLTRAAIEMAEAVKHGRTPDRTKAGIAADAVILLANMLRRLEELRRP